MSDQQEDPNTEVQETDLGEAIAEESPAEDTPIAVEPDEQTAMETPTESVEESVGPDAAAEAVAEETDLPDTMTTDDVVETAVQEAPTVNDSIADDVVRMGEQLEQLTQLVSARLQYDEVKERVIDRQHAELTKLREGLKRDLLRPVLYDLAQTLDDMRKAKGAYEAQGNADAAEAIDDAMSMLVFMLEKYDVEQVISSEGDAFTTKQRMLKTVATADESRAKLIAESVAPGYVWGEEPLFKEKVRVYKYVPQTVETPTAAEPADKTLVEAQPAAAPDEAAAESVNAEKEPASEASAPDTTQPQA